MKTFCFNTFLHIGALGSLDLVLILLPGMYPGGALGALPPPPVTKGAPKKQKKGRKGKEKERKEREKERKRSINMTNRVPFKHKQGLQGRKLQGAKLTAGGGGRVPVFNFALGCQN